MEGQNIQYTILNECDVMLGDTCLLREGTFYFYFLGTYYEIVYQI